MSTINVAAGERTLRPVNAATAAALSKWEDDPARALVRLPDTDLLYSDAWSVTTDLITGNAIVVRRADCGLGCRCAAEVMVLP